MRLIGMMDSPYVQRVAASLQLMEVPFTSEQVSVFRDYDSFAAINPMAEAAQPGGKPGSTAVGCCRNTHRKVVPCRTASASSVLPGQGLPLRGRWRNSPG